MIILTTLFFYNCKTTRQSVSANPSAVNTAHLDALYEEIKMNGREVGIIHIYAEYPDYHWVGDQDEGMTCVDDISRAAIFYLRQYKSTSSAVHLHKAKMLLGFLMEMQAPNGFYYNFIWPDGSINKTGRTSQPKPTWWSWRTLWSIGEAIKTLPSNDDLINQLNQHRTNLLNAMLREKAFFSTVTDTAGGLVIPTWLPEKTATDQASIALLGLTLANQQNAFGYNLLKRDSLLLLINHLADGIIMMQIESSGNFSDGAFLSWNNLWHAYANLESYALLEAGQMLNDPHLESHALYEIDNFYPAVFLKGYLESFWLHQSEGKTIAFNIKSTPQIAYGICPMVLACAKAYEITKDQKYKVQAALLSTWFSGKNPAQSPMYDPLTGRCFDGISETNQINKNSGAESTIEALLTMQAIEEINKKALFRG
jgi:hypothetical protein